MTRVFCRRHAAEMTIGDSSSCETCKADHAKRNRQQAETIERGLDRETMGDMLASMKPADGQEKRVARETPGGGLALAAVARLEAANMMAEAIEQYIGSPPRLLDAAEVYRRVSRCVVETTCKACNGEGREMVIGRVARGELPIGGSFPCKACDGLGIVVHRD